MILKNGKIPNDILKDVLINSIKHTREEVILRPDIGEDCAALDLGDSSVVITTDPVTACSKNIGKLSIEIVCNDLASSGAEPIAVMITILMPEGSKLEELREISLELNEYAEKNKIEIIGGHTEVTNAVSRAIISATGIGKAVKGRIIKTSGVMINDTLIMTKSAGYEGTAIISSEKETELKNRFDSGLINRAKDYINNLSVVREGIIAAQNNANAMHDVTEGGVLGAAWEMAESSGIGLIINKEAIPVSVETEKICDFYGIDPLLLISSGCMLIACSNPDEMMIEMKKNNINASIIGIFKGNEVRLESKNGDSRVIKEAETDAIYTVI